MINHKNFIPWSEFRKELLSDPEVKAYHDALQPEFDLICQILDKRLEKNMTQKDLAEKIGTKQSAISRLESFDANPSFKFLKKVAKAFDAKLVVQFQ
ncbi:MAG: Helix-turn-helix domain protein [Candidatus Pacebacteria bacterium GW2011_GWB1_47_8]|nr:MAG: Helix-turn-helix domain protein [Candidatus Pacebacteria bacterium GW2011_GWA1_46_10]KKU84409.1 MAG: Helix-turn-helix domain protein [Candidatus Pacebacteria bacterium GW2011_GWB1_47_8]HCR81162.1 transcriptional regulator [Candidatus Paceibacterota bacterium]